MLLLLWLTATANFEAASSFASLLQNIQGKHDRLTALQIGTVFASESYTCPNAVGVDIGECSALLRTELQLSKLQCGYVSPDMYTCHMGCPAVFGET